MFIELYGNRLIEFWCTDACTSCYECYTLHIMYILTIYARNIVDRVSFALFAISYSIIQYYGRSRQGFLFM